MRHRRLLKLPVKNAIFSIGLIVNTFVWLFCTSRLLQKILELNVVDYTSIEARPVWGVNFVGATASILAGAFLADRIHLRLRFLFCWTLFGTLSSIACLFIETTIGGVLVTSALLSVSLGLGLPACMADLADNTVVENRGKLGGITLFLVLGLGAIMSQLITDNITTSFLFLAGWRGLGLTIFFLADFHKEKAKKDDSVSIISLARQRSFVLYATPWIMFSLVNYLGAPIAANIYDVDTLDQLMMIGNTLAGVFAVVGGFLSDVIGRKRITIVGFVLLGLGYAVLGVYPGSEDEIRPFLFHTVVDGIAWGMLYVIFITTLWGDLAYGKRSEKHYALGSLPYLLSSFLRLTVGPFIAGDIHYTAVFSFASFFLFLAVLPLMYAPETLPEKKMKERELKIYVERAKKIKEEYTG